MRLLFISPLAALTATYFSCYVNTFGSSSYLEVHIHSETGNLSGVRTEVWRKAEGKDVLLATRKTGSDGLTTFELPSGTSEVRVYYSSTPDYAFEVVNLEAGETKRIEFVACSTCGEASGRALKNSH